MSSKDRKHICRAVLGTDKKESLLSHLHHVQHVAKERQKNTVCAPIVSYALRSRLTLHTFSASQGHSRGRTPFYRISVQRHQTTPKTPVMKHHHSKGASISFFDGLQRPCIVKSPQGQRCYLEPQASPSKASGPSSRQEPSCFLQKYHQAPGRKASGKYLEYSTTKGRGQPHISSPKSRGIIATKTSMLMSKTSQDAHQLRAQKSWPTTCANIPRT